jgi:hypothetical protein
MSTARGRRLSIRRKARNTVMLRDQWQIDNGQQDAWREFLTRPLTPESDEYLFSIDTTEVDGLPLHPVPGGRRDLARRIVRLFRENPDLLRDMLEDVVADLIGRVLAAVLPEEEG